MAEHTRDSSTAGGETQHAPAKRPYRAPRLTVHGTVETVTQHTPPGQDKPKKHTKHPHPH